MRGVKPETHAPRGEAPDAPPPLGSWRRLYVLVLGALLAEIVLLAWLSRSFR